LFPRSLVGGSLNHDRVHFTENDIDAARYSGHDKARRHRDETRHDRILDKILATLVSPDSQIDYAEKKLL
jgi:hypothetical protein